MKGAKTFLTICAFYNVLLGVLFALFPAAILRRFGAEPPSPLGYLQFSALLLIIFGVIFLRTAKDPAAHRELIVYGMARCAALFVLVFFCVIHNHIRIFWISLAWVDLVLFLALWLLWRRLSKQAAKA